MNEIANKLIVRGMRVINEYHARVHSRDSPFRVLGAEDGEEGERTRTTVSVGVSRFRQERDEKELKGARRGEEVVVRIRGGVISWPSLGPMF